jgi:hypothetical protein
LIHESYKDARAAFLQAAHDRSVAISEHPLSGAQGREGEVLAMDVAVVGEPAAPKALLVVSGEHGLEGLPGSGAQLDLLLHMPDPPKDTKVVLVHALNPWGFSHGSRTNEDNVDVNRNFVNFDVPYVRNLAFDEIFPFMCPQDWTDDALDHAAAQTKRVLDEHGGAFVLTGTTGGQRHEPTGTNYGGAGPSWTRRTLEQIVAENLASCEKVAFVDWHSGFGEHGELFHLCTHAEGSAPLDRVATWWGREAVTRNATAFQGAGGAVPNWQGMFATFLPGLIPNAEVAGSVIEFGTFPNAQVRAAIMIDRFLRFGRTNRSSLSRDALRQQMVTAFAPADAAWRAAVLARASDAHQKALEGLAAW